MKEKNMVTKFSTSLPKLASNLHPFTSVLSMVVRNASCGKVKPQPRDFTIEAVKECDKDKIVSFVKKHYLKEKPLAKALIPGQEPERFTKLTKEAVCKNLSVVAKRSCGSCNIIGVCINDRSTVCDAVKLEKMAKGINGCNLRKFMETKALVTRASDVNTRLCQREVFHIETVSVCKNHWGKGIGLELVRKSLEVAAMNNFKFAKMTCMCENTKILAESVGMKKIWSASYEDILNFCGSKPRALPKCPHTKAYVYFMDLQCKPKKC